MGSRPQVEVLPDPASLMQAAAQAFVDSAAAALRTSDRFLVALSGGSTPKRLYELLATERFASSVNWARVHVCWGDERCVPPSDPESNYGMAVEALLGQVPIPEENVHRIRGEDEPVVAAAAYELELRSLFATAEGAPRSSVGARFGLVLLGMGSDGHTASIFPGSSAVREERRWAVAELAGRTWRVTLTLPVFNSAAQVLFLVSGKDKAATLSHVLEGPRHPDELPAQAILPPDGRVSWLVDAAAAAGFERGFSQ